MEDSLNSSRSQPPFLTHNKTLIEKHLRKFGAFLASHSSHLRRTLALLGERRAEEYQDAFPFLLQTLSRRSPITLSAFQGNDVPSTTSGPEEIICLPLPPEGNPDVQKVLLVLTNLVLQCGVLGERIRKQFTLPILLYGEGIEEDEGESLTTFSTFLPLLFEGQEVLSLVRQLGTHFFSQMAALFKGSRPQVVEIAGLKTPEVFLALSNLLSELILLDEVVKGQVLLQDHFARYKGMISSVQADAGTFGVTGVDSLFHLERSLFSLEKEVMSGNSFRSLIGHLGSVKCPLLSEKISQFLVASASSLEEEGKCVGMGGLFVLLWNLFPEGRGEWKRVFQRNMLEGYKKVHLVPLLGPVVWVPEDFLSQHVPSVMDQKVVSIFSTNRQNYLTSRVASLGKDVSAAILSVASWTARMQHFYFSKPLNQLGLSDLSKRCTLLSEGLKLAQGLGKGFRILLSLHAYLGKPVSSKVVSQLCQMLELLKQVEVTFFRFWIPVANSSIHIVQHVLHTALLQLKVVQKAVGAKLDENRADLITVLKILENALRGPQTKTRITVAKVALDWALSRGGKGWRWDDEASLILQAAVDRISLVVEFKERVKEACDGSELFWHRAVLSTYLSSTYKKPGEAEKLGLMWMALGDCYNFLGQSPQKEKAQATFIREVETAFRDLGEKLGQDVETDLRLLTHSHLQTRDGQELTTPFRVGVKEYQFLLKGETLAFEPSMGLDFKLLVEHYLNKTFYNLASVALHDWQSYATMKVLADDKYKLPLIDDYLPGHCLEQGRDILEIVRNLPTFVQEFTYNLNNQVFVQISSPNKHLDTVNIRHLANSMRTHGTGMANTAVNAAYQFLRQKIHIFSQCLYEEQIRSKLSRDIRTFKQMRQEETNANFPFKVAEKFKKGVKKFGVQDGLTWLDKFRILITQIGNALGLVRLVRSGSLHYLAGGYRFVQDLEDVSSLEEAKDEIKILHNVNKRQVEELQQATDAADSTLKSLFGGDNYFDLLVKAFRTGCTTERNAHLKNFYILVPALTLSFVDYMRQCKEVLAKRSKGQVIFSDDGFAMGIAYLLQVLAQDEDFDSLGWFDSVRQQYEEEKRRETQLVTEAKNDEKLEQTSKLTAKRFQEQLQEFELLHYNLSSARIFFQYKSSELSKTETECKS